MLLDKVGHFDEISRDRLSRSRNVKLIQQSYSNHTAITQQRYDVCELSVRSMICLCVANEKSMRLIEAL